MTKNPKHPISVALFGLTFNFHSFIQPALFKTLCLRRIISIKNFEVAKCRKKGLGFRAYRIFGVFRKLIKFRLSGFWVFCPICVFGFFGLGFANWSGCFMLSCSINLASNQIKLILGFGNCCFWLVAAIVWDMIDKNEISGMFASASLSSPTKWYIK